MRRMLDYTKANDVCLGDIVIDEVGDGWILEEIKKNPWHTSRNFIFRHISKSLQKGVPEPILHEEFTNSIFGQSNIIVIAENY